MNLLFLYRGIRNLEKLYSWFSAQLFMGNTRWYHTPKKLITSDCFLDVKMLLGWGTTTTGGAVSSVLLDTAVNVVTRAVCNTAYSNQVHSKNKFGINSNYLSL